MKNCYHQKRCFSPQTAQLD